MSHNDSIDNVTPTGTSPDKQQQQQQQQQQLSKLEFDIALLDFDGTLVNSEHTHFHAFNQLLTQHQCSTFSFDDYSNYLALDDRHMIEMINHRFMLNWDETKIQEMMQIKAKLYIELMLQHVHDVIQPHALALLSLLHQHQIPIVIVSSANRHDIEQILEKLNARKYVIDIVATEDVKHIKPHPEPYIKGFTIAQQYLLNLSNGNINNNNNNNSSNSNHDNSNNTSTENGHTCDHNSSSNSNSNNNNEYNKNDVISSSNSNNHIHEAHNITNHNNLKILVVEDGAGGVRAARTAGCTVVVGVTHSISREKLSEAGAHCVVDSLGQLISMLEQHTI